MRHTLNLSSRAVREIKQDWSIPVHLTAQPSASILCVQSDFNLPYRCCFFFFSQRRYQCVPRVPFFATADEYRKGIGRRESDVERKTVDAEGEERGRERPVARAKARV